MAVWYCGSADWTAVTTWAALTVYNVGDLRRQLATPTVGEERVFRCTTAGTSGAAEPAPWTLTKGGTTTDGSAIWTEVTGNSTYNWTAPHARMANAATWMAAGDTLYVSDSHAWTQAAAMTITFPGTLASPNTILCVDNAGSVPPVSADVRTTATETTTGASGISVVGTFYSYGVTFNVGTGAAAANFNTSLDTLAQLETFDTCAIALLTTHASSRIVIRISGAVARALHLLNVTLKFGAVGQGITLGKCDFIWRGGAIDAAGSAPTALFVNPGTEPVLVRVVGVNLNAMGSGKALVNVAGFPGARFKFEQCKLGAAVALATGTFPGPGLEIDLHNCDSGDTNYRMELARYAGNVYSETTIIRTGGASDGTTGLSHKMVSSANSKFYAPLYGPEMVIWNDAVGSSQTVTCEIAHSAAALLTDAEVWLETEYLGTSGFPLSLFVNDRAADILATPVNQTTSAAAWAGSQTYTQQLVTTHTPQEVGYYRCRVALAKASTTVYACPKLAISGANASVRQSLIPGGAYSNELTSARPEFRGATL